MALIGLIIGGMYCHFQGKQDTLKEKPLTKCCYCINIIIYWLIIMVILCLPTQTLPLATGQTD